MRGAFLQLKISKLEVLFFVEMFTQFFCRNKEMSVTFFLSANIKAL
ncbi:hypothetical protein HMPREF9073_01624 [Capnocytophaga sp. oral taxon 326 str. F0382]|nr:hypothetical protein HMPREF9073_01624 [Capnocytophaga sp. oral taxon 326 str. F0382]